MTSVTLPLSTFRDAFTEASRCVPSKPQKEILQHVLLASGPDGITLLASDSEVTCQVTVPAEPVGQFRCLLNPKRLAPLLRELSSAEITIEAAESRVTVTECTLAANEWTFTAGDPADFPPMERHAGLSMHSMAATALEAAIRRTVFCCDVESARYALGGVQVSFDGERATFAATDSRRLAIATAACQRLDCGGELPAGLIPAKAMRLLADVAKRRSSKNAVISIGINAVCVELGDVVVTAMQVQGRFPDYRKVIPESNRNIIDVTAGPFHQCVRQAQIVTNEESRGVDFELSPGSLLFKSQAADIGRAKIELPVEYAGKPLTACFDPRFVSEFLNQIDPTELVRMAFDDGDTAALLEFGDSYKYVVMPLSRDR